MRQSRRERPDVESGRICRGASSRLESSAIDGIETNRTGRPRIRPMRPSRIAAEIARRRRLVECVLLERDGYRRRTGTLPSVGCPRFQCRECEYLRPREGWRRDGLLLAEPAPPVPCGTKSLPVGYGYIGRQRLTQTLHLHVHTAQKH